MNLNDENKGFTLVELMITLAILTLIVVISVPTFANITDNAEDSADETSVDNVEHAASIADAAGLAHDLERGYSVEYLSDNGYIDVKGSKMDHESSKVELYGPHYYFSSENGIGGRNLILDSNNIANTYKPYQGVTRTVLNDRDYSVPEWGATDATRLRFEGVNPVKYANGYLYTTPQVKSRPSDKVTFSFYAKNTGDTPFSLGYNGLNNRTSGKVLMEPGDAKYIEVTGNQRADYDWFQHQIYADDPTSTVEVVFWHPQLEYGDTSTPWRPAPEDLE